MPDVAPPSAPTATDPATAPQATGPSARHWAVLGLLVVIGGSSFGGIRLAVETAPPTVVAAGRLWIAALVLIGYTLSTGRPLLPLREAGKISGVWPFVLAIALAGYAIPMVLFPFAQQSVSSLLAGIYMAFMPLGTVFLAAIFADEPLTPRKLVGFAAGTLGVIVLIGPAALTNLLSESVIAQLALLAATTGYAIASVVMRRAPDAPARSFSAAFLTVSALMVTPFAVADLASMEQAISAQSWMAIVFLGVLPTGVTAIMLIYLIRGVGAGFMAMANYLTPGAAIVFGVLLFGEALLWRYAAGLGIILAGLAIAQPGPAKALWSKLTSLVMRADAKSPQGR